MNTDDYEEHVMNDDYQVWSWSNDAMKKIESVDQYNSTAALLNAAPDLLAEVKRLQGQLRGMLLAYDSIVDAIRDFIEIEAYCSRDAADWLRYQIDLGGEEK